MEQHALPPVFCAGWGGGGSDGDLDAAFGPDAGLEDAAVVVVAGIGDVGGFDVEGAAAALPVDAAVEKPDGRVGADEAGTVGVRAGTLLVGESPRRAEAAPDAMREGEDELVAEVVEGVFAYV